MNDYEDFETGVARNYINSTSVKKILSEKQIVKRYWNGMLSRVKTGIYLKKKIQVVWTFDEFETWWNENKSKRELIVAAGEVVSIDRIDSNGNYCRENCRIIPNRLNGILGKINQLQGQLKSLYKKAEEMKEWTEY